MTQVNPREGDDDRRADEHGAEQDAEHHDARDRQRTAQDGKDPAGDGGQVSEAGSAGLNEETAAGGADSVPDTPDTSAGDDLG